MLGLVEQYLEITPTTSDVSFLPSHIFSNMKCSIFYLQIYFGLRVIEDLSLWRLSRQMTLLSLVCLVTSLQRPYFSYNFLLCFFLFKLFLKNKNQALNVIVLYHIVSSIGSNSFCNYLE